MMITGYEPICFSMRSNTELPECLCLTISVYVLGCVYCLVAALVWGGLGGALRRIRSMRVRRQ